MFKRNKRERYVITSITEDSILVAPYKEDFELSTLTVSNIKVVNNKNLHLQVGDKVLLNFNSALMKGRAVKGVLFLLAPIFLCGLSIFLSPLLASFFNLTLSIGSKFLISVAVFILSFILLECVAKDEEIINLPSITKVVK